MRCSAFFSFAASAQDYNAQALEYVKQARDTASPEYPYALASLAEVRREQKKFAAAVELYRRRYASNSHPENLYNVGDALVKAGKPGEAAKVFAQFDKAALAESANLGNANRELATYYLEHAGKSRQPDFVLQKRRRTAGGMYTRSRSTRRLCGRTARVPKRAKCRPR